VRFFLLSTHYRSPLDFDDENLAAAGRGLERIKTSIRLLIEAMGKPVHDNTKDLIAGCVENIFNKRLDDFKDSFEAAMDDDFNTALATGIYFDLAREINIFNEVLGVFKVDGRGMMLLDSSAGDGSDLAEGLISLIIEMRQEARQKKDWGTADRIRDGLKELGIVLEDTPQGVRWKKKG
jgi:cysteinyl-tRNA synthetase